MQPWFYIPFLKLVTLATNGGAGGMQQVSQLARAARTAPSISVRSEHIARSYHTSNTATKVTSSRWGSCYTWRCFRHSSPGNRHRRKKFDTEIKAAFKKKIIDLSFVGHFLLIGERPTLSNKHQFLKGVKLGEFCKWSKTNEVVGVSGCREHRDDTVSSTLTMKVSSIVTDKVWRSPA